MEEPLKVSIILQKRKPRHTTLLKFKGRLHFVFDFVRKLWGRYELFIECKACREGNHHNCSGVKNREDVLVEIGCICLDYKKMDVV